MSAERQSTPGTVLVELSFEVPAAPEQAWSALADVESWPRWAPHIARARVSPPGALQASSSGTFRFRLDHASPLRASIHRGHGPGRDA